MAERQVADEPEAVGTDGRRVRVDRLPGDGGVAVVDVEQMRYEVLRGAMGQISGIGEWEAVAKPSQYFRQGLASWMYVFDRFDDEADFGPERKMLLKIGMHFLKPQAPFEKAIDNLSTQTNEKPGLMERMKGWFK